MEHQLVRPGYHRIDRWKVRRIWKFSIFTYCEDLVKSTWGRIVQGFRSISNFETGISFTSLSRRKTAQSAIWIKDTMSWKFGKLANNEITLSECLILGFRESGQGFQSGHEFSLGCQIVCVLDVRCVRIGNQRLRQRGKCCETAGQSQYSLAARQCEKVL